ncbi:hypothetical protein HNQ02_003640 [Flavobacterium sp. 7E]|nr:hypothetical protein [Flavobacterium sp. 7E]
MSIYKGSEFNGYNSDSKDQKVIPTTQGLMTLRFLYS